MLPTSSWPARPSLGQSLASVTFPNLRSGKKVTGESQCEVRPSKKMIVSFFTVVVPFFETFDCGKDSFITYSLIEQNWVTKT